MSTRTRPKGGRSGAPLPARPHDARREGRAPRRGPHVETAPLPHAPEPAAARGAIVLAIVLAVLAALRALAATVPGMSLWGVNHIRFVGPLFGWPLWALSALALVPFVARPVARALEKPGDAIAGAPGLAALLLAIGGAAIVLALPDRLRFVGDFLLRQGTVEESGRPGLLFPQALPLDVFLHVTLPTRVMEAGWLDANGAARALGAIEAAALAALAVLLVRVLALRGAPAVAVIALAWWSGALSMYTGYSKAFGELALLAVAAAVFALRSLRSGEPPLGVGVVLAIGLTLHRSALGLVPIVAVSWVMWAFLHGRGGGGWRRPATWIALAVPLGALALMLPRIVETFLRWDTVHLAPAEVKRQGGPLRAAFAGRRPLDLANLLLVLAPLAPALLAALLALGRGLPRRREAVLLAALVLPLVLAIPLIHPAQGLFRDWDDFAFAAAALAIGSAWVAGEILRGAPRFAWLAPALVLGALVPSLQWLAVQNDLDRGLARIEALVQGPPPREGPEWGNTWDYVGIRNFRLERWSAPAAAFQRAAETSPSPRILRQWGLAESNAGDHAAAQRVFRLMTQRNPEDYNAWAGLAAESSQLTDAAAAREAAGQMLRLRPGDRSATMLLESIVEYEAKHPTSP